MIKLSLVIVAQNEARTIGDVLAAAAPLADEIVFVDSGSTDETLNIAQRFRAKIIHQDWLGYAAQKNFALQASANDWVLSLDADEVLTPDLVSEIESMLLDGSIERCDGYRIPRLLYIGDRAVARGGFYPDAQLRLFRKAKGRFNNRAVHERVFVGGKVSQLKNCMHHRAYRDLNEFAAAMDKYARLSAQHYQSVGYNLWRVSAINELLHPLWTFANKFIFRGGFLDGLFGLRVNLIYSDYVRRKIRYLRQAHESE